MKRMWLSVYVEHWLTEGREIWSPWRTRIKSLFQHHVFPVHHNCQRLDKQTFHALGYVLSWGRQTTLCQLKTEYGGLKSYRTMTRIWEWRVQTRLPGISITPGYRQESEKEQLAKACGPVVDDQLARLSLTHGLTCTLVSDNITQRNDLTQKQSHNTRVRNVRLQWSRWRTATVYKSDWSLP